MILLHTVHCKIHNYCTPTTNLYLIQYNFYCNCVQYKYALTEQAGPIYDRQIQEPNDPVIEGRYNEYMVDSAFSEDKYSFGLFNENGCVTTMTTP